MALFVKKLCWYPQQESNLCLDLRSVLFYPLNYGDGYILKKCDLRAEIILSKSRPLVI